MTAIKGFIGPSRRPGELGVHSVDRFHFFVPDLATAKNFYSEFGLEVRERGGLLTLNTHGHPHSWGTVGEGPRKKFGHLSFGAFDEDIDRFSERLPASPGSIHPPESIRMESGFTIRMAF
jgi:hypothetical protein